MKRALSLGILVGSLLSPLFLSGCSAFYYHKYSIPATMVSPQDSTRRDIVELHHNFTPDRANYGVCGDTLALLWGRTHDAQIDLFVSRSTKPGTWSLTQYVTTADTAVLEEWGAIPAELPLDFDCRQALLTPTTQSTTYELFQSPVQSPWRCSSLYDDWVTVVDRSTRKAMVTDIPLAREVEFFTWKNHAWIGDTKAMIGFDPQNYGKDTDGDGLSDILEGILGTRADLVDSDGDGILDALDMQPSAAVRELNPNELKWKLAMEEALRQNAITNGCVTWIAVEAPGIQPFEMTIPAGIRLAWNPPHWRGARLRPFSGAIFTP